MERLRDWLCPTPAHRVRVVEASPRTRVARLVAAGAIGVGVLLAAPWTGWWTLVLFVPAGIHLVTVDRWLDRSDSPELIAFGTMIAMIAMIALSAALTGGPHSPVLPWVALIPAIATLRFRLGVCVTLLGVSALAIVVVGVSVDAAGAWADPVPMIAALVTVANILAICTALMYGELEHRDRAVIDPLTGLLNRAALESRIPELEQQARLTGGSVCLVLCDLDRFKEVNDTYGHDRGDAALKEVAYAARKSLREFELVYRIGGEELLIVLPGLEQDQGLAAGERVRANVEEARPAGLDLTVSVGVAAAAGDRVRYESLFRLADLALLRAKREGRNRAVPAAEPRAVVAA